MPDLEVIDTSSLEVPEVPERVKYPEGLHVRLRFDADTCQGSVYEGETFLVGGGYQWVKNFDSWQECRDAALEETLTKVAIIQKYGAPPANEVVELS